ncbi:McrB family protein [Domibacillus tundrae]|uniref:McrB family protein n=1 Tax=Domibacillus tundrae TaxID=1587527 RepID=UPI0006183531|nr:AAA family ATPase [Domibacillus tundrae]
MEPRTKAIRHHSSFTINSHQEIDEYISETFDIQDHYLVGSVKETKRGAIEPDFFFIENLVNPFTGQKIGKLLEGGRPKSNAICRHAKPEDFGLKGDQLVLFQFRIDIQSNLGLSKGEVLAVEKESLKPIEDNYDILRELKITSSDLRLSGIIDKTNDNDIKFFFFNDYYKDVIQEKVESEISKIKDEKDELEEQKKEIRINLDEKKQLLEQIEKKDKGVQDVKRANAKENKRLVKLKEEIHQMNGQLKTLGFSVLDEEKMQEVKNFPSLKVPKEEIELVKGIQQQITSTGLYYEENTIRKLYTALKTNQFTILNGPSGTGKTSLIAAFAEVVSAVYKIIPVQPSWVDKQDLLGFYNPMRKQYVPSVFLDTLIDAEENPEKLYLICLDELNLAQIEYYLADILSIRELKKPQLELYSHYEYEQSMEEISWYVQKVFHAETDIIDEWVENTLNISNVEQIAYMQRYKNLKRYPNTFTVPQNVRLIGTMNVDGTVRPLSPKVIDRSFIIELLKQNEKVKAPEKVGQYELPASYFDVNEKGKGPQDFKKKLQKFENLFTQLKADYNNRVDKHLDLYSSAAESFKLTPDALGDELFAMKLLPRIHFLMDETMIRDHFVNLIKDEFGEESLSYKKVRKMLSTSNRTKIFSYWS